MHTIAIIPARAGSKGLPGKNIRDLCGKPLSAYSIEAAVACSGFDRVVVSTDSEEIASIARAYGAEVPFLRPAAMAGDHSNIGEAIDHLLCVFKEQGYTVDAYATLYPTHPFRPAGLVDLLTAKLREGYSPVLTVRRVRCEPYPVRLDADGASLRPLPFPERAPGLAAMPFYRSYGLYCGIAPGVNGPPYLHEVTTPHHLIDIDFLEDFLLAEEIVRSGLLATDMPCEP